MNKQKHGTRNNIRNIQKNTRANDNLSFCPGYVHTIFNT